MTGDVPSAEMTANNDMFDLRTVHSELSENHQASQRQQSHFRGAAAGGGSGQYPTILKKLK